MLNKQTVSLTFSGGLASKTDEFQVQSPNLLALENAQFDKIGALNKRPGYNILNNQILSDGQITSAVALNSFNGELTLFDNNNIYSYIQSTSSWANRGPAISLINTDLPIIRHGYDQQLNPDVVFVDNVKVYAWEDSRGTCRYSVLDQETDAFIVSDVAINDSINRPKLITNPANGLIYFFYTSHNSLLFRTINPATPNLISLAQVVTTDGYGDFPYDVAGSTNNPFLLVAWFGNSGGTPRLEVKTISSSGFVEVTPGVVVSGSTAISNQFINSVSMISVSIARDVSDQTSWISWSNGSAIYTSAYDNNFNYILHPLLVANATCPLLVSIESVNLGSLQLIYEVYNPTSSNESVSSVVIQTSGNIIPIGSLLSVGISSKPFLQNGNNFINLAYQSAGAQYFPNGPVTPLQNTYFTTLLTNVPFTIVGKISPGVGGGLRSNNMASEVVQPSPGIFLQANGVKGPFISEDNTNFSLIGVNETISDFTDSNKFNAVTFSNNLLFVGGILQSYDGVSVTEQNFHLYPEDIAFAPSFSSQGQLSQGQYQYQILYAWTDRYGQVSYSTPSPTITVTIGPGQNAVSFLLPTLRLTAKTNVIIKIYRTSVNGIIFNETTSELEGSPQRILNNPQIDTISYTDTNSDRSIQANQTIYTTGGVLPNAGPPSCSLIALFSDRVFIGGLEDKNLLWFSKNKSDNSNFNVIPTEFSALNVFSVNEFGGPITALGLMDQNLIIFKENAIYALSGDGPNDLGQGNSFPDATLITQSVGCANQNSVHLTTNGIMFQTPNKGIWMMPRGLGEPTYIGAGVNTDAIQYLVSSSNLDPNSNSIIFTTFNGPALVYDYLIGQWSEFTNHKAADACIFNNNFTYVRSNGSVYQQDQSIFYDGYVGGEAIPYSLSLITPWLSYASNLGYQSIFRFFILGTYQGAHNLNVSVAYQWNPAFTSSSVINATNLIGQNNWGADAFWGNSTPWGGISQPYVFQVNMKTQKCSSFRIQLNDSQTAPYNQGFTLSNLLIELGVFGDGLRLPATNKVST